MTATDSMVERVAKAQRAAEDEFDLDPPREGESYEEWEERRWLVIARAAIEAMREPTEAMGRAGMVTPHAENYRRLAEDEGARLLGEPEPVAAPIHGAVMAYEAWHAMIDAALTREPASRGEAENTHPGSPK